jgi:AcrR family transcriptional regulator
LGINAASIDVIAENAGFSKGGFYSNFKSKEDIFLALLEEHLNAEVAALSRLISESVSVDDLLAKIDELYTNLFTDPTMCVLSVEFQLLAMRNEIVRKRYQELSTHHRATLIELLQNAMIRFHTSLRSDPAEVIDILTALAHGLVLQKSAGTVLGKKTDISGTMTQYLRMMIQSDQSYCS